MTLPKLQPCPRCKTDEYMAIYTYEVARHVECMKCFYLGPAAGSKLQAARLHNKRVTPDLAAMETLK